jgi:hypothetical protein
MSEIDTWIDIFSRDVHTPSPTYNDLVLALTAVKNSLGTGGAGSGEIIDLGDRMTGSEFTDLGLRV